MQRIQEGFPCTLGVYYVKTAVKNGHLHCLDLPVFLATGGVSSFSNLLTAHSFVSSWQRDFCHLGLQLQLLPVSLRHKESPISGAMGTKVATSLWKDAGWHVWHVCTGSSICACVLPQVCLCRGEGNPAVIRIRIPLVPQRGHLHLLQQKRAKDSFMLTKKHA